MKFRPKEERCLCGQDLTGIKVKPGDILWRLVGDEKLPYTECPRCYRYCPVEEVKARHAEPVSEPEE